MLTMRWLIVAAAVLVGCQASPAPLAACDVTPTSTRVVGGYTLVGKADRDIFVYLESSDRVLRTEATGPEKLLIFLARLPDPLPSSIRVDGENLSTHTRRTFQAQLHASEFGSEWGTNFYFPDAGCWQLSFRQGDNEGRVVLVVI
jgi:hypothetical protein